MLSGLGPRAICLFSWTHTHEWIQTWTGHPTAGEEVSRAAGSREQPVCRPPPRGHLPHVRAAVGLGYNVVMSVKYSFRIDSSLLDLEGR